MDGHFALIPPSADSGDPFFNDTHWAVTRNGRGAGMPPNSVNDKSIRETVERIAKYTNKLIKLPADSDEGRETARKIQEQYKGAFEKFAKEAGSELALRVKRSAKEDPDGVQAVDW